MVSFVLWNIGLQEGQERVGLGRSGSDVIDVSRSCRWSGNGFCRIVLGEFRCEVCGKGGDVGWGGSGEVFYLADVVIGSLKNENEVFRMSLETEGRVNARGCECEYLWRWLVTLEFLEVQVLNEIYVVKLSICYRVWMYSRQRTDPFGGRKKMTGTWRTWKQSVSEKRAKAKKNVRKNLEICGSCTYD